MTNSETQRFILDQIKAAVIARRGDRRSPGRLPNRLHEDVLALLVDGLDAQTVAAETGPGPE